jgi:hypothetical protein
MPAAATDLETGVHQWTRMVKLALGLRTPDSWPLTGHGGVQPAPPPVLPAGA